MSKIELYLLPMLDVCEKAALAALDWVGFGERNLADKAAVESMRQNLGFISMSGRISIGEGERDKAPMLFIGEELGMGGTNIDIAVDPLEGTNLCANGAPGALAVLAFGERGSILHAPDLYMDKLAVHPTLSSGISIANSIEDNLEILRRAKNCQPRDIKVVVLNRDRHQSIIGRIRNFGAKVFLIEDGDIAAAISVLMGKKDMYVGIGGAPEGVLAAAAFSAWGQGFEGRLIFDNDDDRQRAIRCGISDFDKVYSTTDLISGKVYLIATGVTSGELVKGPWKCHGYMNFESVVFDSDVRGMRRVSSKKEA